MFIIRMTDKVQRLKCHICATSDTNTNANHICYLNISNDTLQSCPDLSFTSCFVREQSYRTAEGTTYFLTERGCSDDVSGGCSEDGCNNKPNIIIGIPTVNITTEAIPLAITISPEDKENSPFQSGENATEIANILTGDETELTVSTVINMYLNITLFTLCLIFY